MACSGSVVGRKNSFDYLDGAAQAQCPHLANPASAVYRNATAATNLQVVIIPREVRGDWEEKVHPSGATYYYNKENMTYTELNLRTCSDEQLQRLESWIDASRSKLREDQWFLVVDPILARGQEIYTYYYVVPERRLITWLEPVDAYLLFQEFDFVGLELEAQFWKHVEYFPFEISISLKEVRALQTKLNWYRVGELFRTARYSMRLTDRQTEALALEKSTAASLFWSLDQMKEMAFELAIAGPNEIMDAPGVAICGKLFYIIHVIKLKTEEGHHEYLNHYGQPEARLMRTHSVGEKRGNIENSPAVIVAAVAMFCIPMMVLKRLRDIYVDGLVSGVDIKRLADDFSAQSKVQTTIASIIMAVDASILAIPGVLYAKEDGQTCHPRKYTKLSVFNKLLVTHWVIPVWSFPSWDFSQLQLGTGKINNFQG
ncbi:hypothetical protein BDR07DRAFT_1373985 [Suillus spraguei]|nr:hypothetical protein BDR07DRAFT_1373985 [Suillus spraguei]